MNDLLTDSFVGDANYGQPSRQNDIEMGRQDSRSNSDMGMETFDEQTQEIDKQIEKLSRLLEKLTEANEVLNSVTEASSMKSLNKRMEKDIDEVGKIAHGVKAKIEALNRDNLANRQKPDCEKGTGIDRARMNIAYAFTRKFKDLLIDFLTLMQRIRDAYREILMRRIITGVSDGTITGRSPDVRIVNVNMIEVENSQRIFVDAMAEARAEQILNGVEEIQDRRDAVNKFETKLLGLHQIYLDMAALVDAHGENFNNIESQVNNAVDHVQRGTSALQNAKKLQKNSRKWMCIAIIILLIIVAIIVVGVLQPWKSNKGA